MSAQLIADRMYYWCTIADLGYCWDHRFDIRDGGETDCSALYLFTLWEAGYLQEKPTWGNTDTLRSQLEPLGFKFVKANNSATAPAGVGLLRKGHVAVSMGDGKVAQASINENGQVRGGKPGDQTGLETKVSKDPRNWLWWIYPPDEPIGSPNFTEASDAIHVTGIWDIPTTKALQKALGTTQDGIISGQAYSDLRAINRGGLSVSTWKTGKGGSDVIYALQKKIGAKPDRYFGRNSLIALQKYCGTTKDGVVSNPSDVVREMQRRLNAGTF